jgi:hypothetical protein
MEEGSPLRLDEKRQNASPFRPYSLIPRPSPSAFQPSNLLIFCSLTSDLWSFALSSILPHPSSLRGVGPTGRRPSPSAFQPSYLLISCSPPLLVVVKRKSRYRGPIFIRPISHLRIFLPSNLLPLTSDL